MHQWNSPIPDPPTPVPVPAAVRSDYADDPEYRELLELFLAAVPEHRRQLQDAHRAANLDALWRRAHQLKGAGAGYGFRELSLRAAALEAACKSTDDARIAATLDSLLAHLGCITL
jgi:HPt (histidine-containing phosphotransfer) domain-containing protein